MAETLKLKTFEVLDHCRLNKFEIKSIKENMEHKISVINRRISEVHHRHHDRLIECYERELFGMHGNSLRHNRN